jgi:hypothetical protein
MVKWSLKMEATKFSETLLSYHNTALRQNPEDLDFNSEISFTTLLLSSTVEEFVVRLPEIAVPV